MTKDEAEFMSFVSGLRNTFGLSEDEALHLAWRIACLAWKVIPDEAVRTDAA